MVKTLEYNRYVVSKLLDYKVNYKNKKSLSRNYSFFT